MLKLDHSKLKHEVRFEAAAPVGDKATKTFRDGDAEDVQVFPHLYGTINFDAVIAELSVKRASDGTFESIDGV